MKVKIILIAALTALSFGAKAQIEGVEMGAELGLQTYQRQHWLQFWTYNGARYGRRTVFYTLKHQLKS